MGFEILVGIFLIATVAAIILLFAKEFVMAAAAAFLAIILLFIVSDMRTGDKIEDTLADFRPSQSTQTVTTESPNDTGTCKVDDRTDPTTRGFCDAVDGEFTPDNESGGTAPSTQTPGTTSGGVATATTNVQSDPAPTQPAPQDVVSTGSLPDLPVDQSHSGWEIRENAEIDNDPIVRDRLGALMTPDPANWQTFPNVPNPNVAGFDVANGAEYGVANVPFCQQDMRCDFIVPARHYRLITADYEFLGRSCKGADGHGCLLLLINVGGESYTWRDQIADNGFTVPGQYWNGDRLEWAIQGLVSHASANMLDMPTLANENGEVLNADTTGNAGANCGTPEACSSVDAFVVIHAGDRILATAHTVVTRP